MTEVAKSALIELGRAWNAFNEDESNYDRLGTAVMRVLGRPESEARKLLRKADKASVLEIPKDPRAFGASMTQAQRDAILRHPAVQTAKRR